AGPRRVGLREDQREELAVGLLTTQLARAGQPVSTRACVPVGVTESQLVVSVSGLTPDAGDALADAAAFTAELQARGVPASHLLRPAGVAPGSPLARWVHERRAAGDGVALHGHEHPAPPGASLRSGG